MKKLFSLLAVIAMLISLAACDATSFSAGVIKMVNGYQDHDITTDTKSIGADKDKKGSGAAALKGGISSLRITVDPGHGGIDCGAVGVDTGVYESVLNLEVAKLVADEFKQAGADVLMTRETADVDYSAEGDTPKLKDMNNRAKLVNGQNPQILVSVHMNTFSDRKAKGAQVFYQQGSEPGEALASCIQDALNADATVASKRSVQAGDFFMLRITESPSVIVECGFLSNHDEEKKLQDPQYREKLADSIFVGICTYLGVGKK